MNINFLNGTDQQQGVFRAAMRGLLHLDLDAIPGSIDVSFVPDPEPTTVNEFAFAQATSGSTGEIKMRDDFPDFAPRALWGSNAFARETVIHEIGHVLLGWLPPASQEAIAAMFGTVPSQWNPQDRPWVDRPLEGIVETFKDAFLPARLRQHFNRTNHRIPIRRYPEFRQFYRTINIVRRYIPPSDDRDAWRFSTDIFLYPDAGWIDILWEDDRDGPGHWVSRSDTTLTFSSSDLNLAQPAQGVPALIPGGSTFQWSLPMPLLGSAIEYFVFRHTIGFSNGTWGTGVLSMLLWLGEPRTIGGLTPPSTPAAYVSLVRTVNPPHLAHLPTSWNSGYVLGDLHIPALPWVNAAVDSEVRIFTTGPSIGMKVNIVHDFAQPRIDCRLEAGNSSGDESVLNEVRSLLGQAIDLLPPDGEIGATGGQGGTIRALHRIGA